MAKMGCDDNETYFAMLQDGGVGLRESAELLHCITGQQKKLFCDPVLVNLIEQFLAERIESLAKGICSLDLWSAGCGSGAEAWTLVMLAKAAIERQQASLHYGVIGTDISSSVLQEARRAVYREDDLSQVPADHRVHGLKAIDTQHSRIVDELAERVCFVQSNLVTAEELLGIDMDVIVCRDVLTYYCQESKYRILDCLADHLKPGGLLVVGAGESGGWTRAGVHTVSVGKLEAYIRQ
jgi:chemotaxis protein methyltransferase CheR/type IV pilus assembly protein PilK